MLINDIRTKFDVLPEATRREAHYEAFERALNALESTPGIDVNTQESVELSAWFNVLRYNPVNISLETPPPAREELLNQFQQAAAATPPNYAPAMGQYQAHALHHLKTSIQTLVEIDEDALAEYDNTPDGADSKIAERRRINAALESVITAAVENTHIPNSERNALTLLVNRSQDPRVANGEELLITDKREYKKAIRTLRDLPRTIKNQSTAASEDLTRLEDSLSEHHDNLKAIQEAKAENEAKIKNKEAEDAAVQQARFNASLGKGVGQINYRNYVIRSSPTDGKKLVKGLRNAASLITNIITLGHGIRKDFDATISLSDENSERNIAYTKCKLTNAQVEHMVFAFLGRRTKDDWEHNVPVIVDGYDDDCLIRACALLDAMGIKYEFGEKTKKMFETRTDFNKQALIAHSTARFGLEMLMNRYVNGMPRDEFESKVTQASNQLKKQALPKSREECEQRAQKFVTRKTEKSKQASRNAISDNAIPAPSARTPGQA